MTKSTSLYLDFLRVVAAFGVLFVHANLSWFSSGLFLPEQLGHKLVMVFFVLSGFLIAFTVKNKNRGLKSYVVDRFSRLYSVVVPALLITYLLDAIGGFYNPDVYVPAITHGNQVARGLLNLGFLGQIWTLCTKPSSNGPFWSLHYEFWYYMLFGIFCFKTGIIRNLGLLMIGLLLGPKILLLFPVWVFGVLAYFCSIRFVIAGRTAAMLFSITLILLLVLTFTCDFTFFAGSLRYGQAPLFYSSNFIFDWIYGFLLAIHLYSFGFIGFNSIIPAIITKPVRYLSSITFSLYLFHVPILLLMAAVIPYQKSSYWQTGLLLCATLLIVSLLAAITEKQRKIWDLIFGRAITVASNRKFASKCPAN